MEHHVGLYLVLSILSVDDQQFLLEVAANTKPEICMDLICQRLVLFYDEISRLIKDFIKWGADLKYRDEVALGVVSNLVSGLLFRSGVDD